MLCVRVLVLHGDVAVAHGRAPGVADNERVQPGEVLVLALGVHDRLRDDDVGLVLGHHALDLARLEIVVEYFFSSAVSLTPLVSPCSIHEEQSTTRVGHHGRVPCDPLVGALVHARAARLFARAGHAPKVPAPQHQPDKVGRHLEEAGHAVKVVRVSVSHRQKMSRWLSGLRLPVRLRSSCIRYMHLGQEPASEALDDVDRKRRVHAHALEPLAELVHGAARKLLFGALLVMAASSAQIDRRGSVPPNSPVSSLLTFTSTSGSTVLRR